ncbi:MAG TPA: hypothetical protein VGM29_08490 [Polyangiaceae bacterium]
MATIAILGAGMMGSALTTPLVDRGHSLRLIGTHLDTEIIGALKAGREHPTLKLPLSPQIQGYFHDELPQALESVDALALGVSSAGVEWASQILLPFLRPRLPILMVSKGLAWHGEKLVILPDLLQTRWPRELELHPVAVAGPCIAGELARREQTCVLFTSRSASATAAWAALARGPYYHVFPSDDPIGSEVCAALKNAFAMGIGFAAGLHEARGQLAGSIAMHNYEAALYAQSIHEMKRVIALLRGEPETAAGLAGAGDLNVTCNGGRTGRFGRWLGLGLGLQEAILRMQGATLECLEILSVLRGACAHYEQRGELARGELPLLEHLMEVALDGRPIQMPFERFFDAAAPEAER